LGYRKKRKGSSGGLVKRRGQKRNEYRLTGFWGKIGDYQQKREINAKKKARVKICTERKVILYRTNCRFKEEYKSKKKRLCSVGGSYFRVARDLPAKPRSIEKDTIRNTINWGFNPRKKDPQVAN